MGTEAALLDQFRNLESLDLGEIVASILADPDAEIAAGWSCNPLSTVSIGNGTLGFFKLEGNALNLLPRRTRAAVLWDHQRLSRSVRFPHGPTQCPGPVCRWARLNPPGCRTLA